MRLVWRLWEFLVKLVNNRCQQCGVFPAYVAVFYQGRTFKLLVELEAGEAIGIIEVAAWACLVEAHRCGDALPREPPW